jgi:hypothetical protein
MVVKGPSGQQTGCGKGSEAAEKVEEGLAVFIDVESGTGPVRAPCPKRAVAELRSPDRSTETTKIKTSFATFKGIRVLI